MSQQNEDKMREEAHALLGAAGLAAPGSMAEAGGTLHEAYLSFVDSGFTTRQALWLVGTLVSQHGPGVPPTDGEDGA